MYLKGLDKLADGLTNSCSAAVSAALVNDHFINIDLFEEVAPDRFIPHFGKVGNRIDEVLNARIGAHNLPNAFTLHPGAIAREFRFNGVLGRASFTSEMQQAKNDYQHVNPFRVRKSSTLNDMIKFYDYIQKLDDNFIYLVEQIVGTTVTEYGFRSIREVYISRSQIDKYVEDKITGVKCSTENATYMVACFLHQIFDTIGFVVTNHTKDVVSEVTNLDKYVHILDIDECVNLHVVEEFNSALKSFCSELERALNELRANKPAQAKGIQAQQITTNYIISKGATIFQTALSGLRASCQNIFDFIYPKIAELKVALAWAFQYNLKPTPEYIEKLPSLKEVAGHANILLLSQTLNGFVCGKQHGVLKALQPAEWRSAEELAASILSTKGIIKYSREICAELLKTELCAENGMIYLTVLETNLHEEFFSFNSVRQVDRQFNYYERSPKTASAKPSTAQIFNKSSTSLVYKAFEHARLSAKLEALYNTVQNVKYICGDILQDQNLDLLYRFGQFIPHRIVKGYICNEPYYNNLLLLYGLLEESVVINIEQSSGSFAKLDYKIKCATAYNRFTGYKAPSKTNLYIDAKDVFLFNAESKSLDVPFERFYLGKQLAKEAKFLNYTDFAPYNDSSNLVPRTNMTIYIPNYWSRLLGKWKLSSSTVDTTLVLSIDANHKLFSDNEWERRVVGVYDKDWLNDIILRAQSLHSVRENLSTLLTDIIALAKKKGVSGQIFGEMLEEYFPGEIRIHEELREFKVKEKIGNFQRIQRVIQLFDTPADKIMQDFAMTHLQQVYHIDFIESVTYAEMKLLIQMALIDKVILGDDTFLVTSGGLVGCYFRNIYGDALGKEILRIRRDIEVYAKEVKNDH